VFPWYSAQQPILWWSPGSAHGLVSRRIQVCSRSLRKTLRNGRYTTRVDQAFGATIAPARRPRRSGPDTWLNTDMIAAYEQLHAWASATRSRPTKTISWSAACTVCSSAGCSSANRCSAASAMPPRWRWRAWSRSAARATSVIDCQVASAHLASLGAREVSRSEFAALLRRMRGASPAAPGQKRGA
jgi:leucyl/phenylalanyl-tRNA---protein transferase